MRTVKQLAAVGRGGEWLVSGSFSFAKSADCRAVERPIFGQVDLQLDLKRSVQCVAVLGSPLTLPCTAACDSGLELDACGAKSALAPLCTSDPVVLQVSAEWQAFAGDAAALSYALSTCPPVSLQILVVWHQV